MKFNTKTRYGLRAMIELALTENDDGLFQKDIAKNQEISEKYLDHIISALKISGLIKNTRGKKSGYKLTKDPSEITAKQIFNAFEPEFNPIDCLSDNDSCEMNNTCAAKFFWNDLNSTVSNYLESISLDQLAKKQKSLINSKQKSNMYNI